MLLHHSRVLDLAVVRVFQIAGGRRLVRLMSSPLPLTVFIASGRLFISIRRTAKSVLFRTIYWSNKPQGSSDIRRPINWKMSTMINTSQWTDARWPNLAEAEFGNFSSYLFRFQLLFLRSPGQGYGNRSWTAPLLTRRAVGLQPWISKQL
jgi:hypothetical protein